MRMFWTMKSPSRWIGSLLLLWFGAVVAVCAGAQPSGVRDDLLIIGHMGAPAHAVENTIQGFAKAIELGANAIETDLCLTRDGTIVLWHDWDPNNPVANFRQLGRQGLFARPHAPDLFTKARRPVPELSLAELRKHFGYTRRENGLGTRQRLAVEIPTLDQFCAWAASEPGLEKAFFDVKIPAGKTAFVKPFFTAARAVIEKYQLADRVIFMVPDRAILDAAREADAERFFTFCHDQELPPVLIIHPDKFSTVTPALARELEWASIGRPVATFLGWKIYRKIVTADLKRAAVPPAKPGAEPFAGLICWTIDKAGEQSDLLQLGVRGILTNRPDLLKSVANALTASGKTAAQRGAR